VYIRGLKKNNGFMSFSTAFVKKRTAKNTFYGHINTIVNWQDIDNEIVKYYSVGKSATGKPSYSGLLLFKMLLVGVWSGNLSDRLVEEMVNENLSAMQFCGLELEDEVPDHSGLSRFRSLLAKNNAFESIMNLINKQLEQHEIVVKTGVKIDASITDSPRKPRGKTTYQIAEDRKEDEVSEAEKDKQTADIKLVKIVQQGVDTDARWSKKGHKYYYGYKKHIATDENGLVLSLETTAANEHDSLTFEKVIDKATLPKEARIYADKAYKSEKHDKMLLNKKLKNRIHHKATKNHPLTSWQKKFNKRVSSFRYTVERTFGGQVLWFNAGVAKYVGMVKTHAQHALECIAYNLKRSPVLIVKLQISKHQVVN